MLIRFKVAAVGALVVFCKDQFALFLYIKKSTVDAIAVVWAFTVSRLDV